MKVLIPFRVTLRFWLMALWSASAALPQELGRRLQIGDPDVFRIAQLQGREQQIALRGLLAAHDRERTESVFYYGNRLRPSLRALVQDPEVGEAASWSLAMIAVPEDIKTIIDSPPRAKKAAFASRWAYGVVASSLHPTTDAEWMFVRRCALNEYKDGWVDAGAIQTLKLIASPRSRELLLEVQRANANRVSTATRALNYIDSEPVLLSGPSLQALAESVARALGAATWKGNSNARCNELADKALVDLNFDIGMDRLIYTATFHKTDDLWHLYGVRETLQMLVMPPAMTLKKTGR
jgi:hypothetical protein